MPPSSPDMTSPELIDRVHAAVARVPDPEFGLSVADLGLIYDLSVTDGTAKIVMTLTSMYCPAGDIILAGVKAAAETVPGITEARVTLVWDPVWTADMLSPAGRAHLGWDEPLTPA